jgi:hypothetical protein
MLVLASLAVMLAFLLLLPRPAGAAARERWRWPLHGDVVGAFHYTPRNAFAAGARRGIDIAASPGAAVRSACRGRVTFAGPVPGGRGLGVTVRCGDLVATHLGLGRVTVRRGAVVGAGRRLGLVGPAGRLRLGARRAAARFGYIDPLGLLGADPPPAGREPAPGPFGRTPEARRVAPRAPLVAPRPPSFAPRALGHAPRALGRAPGSLGRGPVPSPVEAARSAHARRTAAPPRQAAPAPAPSAGPAPSGAGIPAVVWAGLVLLAAGVPLGGLVHRRRRGRRAAAAVVATEAGR